eukprot:3877365-Prymnesium_polylepis.1
MPLVSAPNGTAASSLAARIDYGSTRRRRRGRAARSPPGASARRAAGSRRCCRRPGARSRARAGP